MKMTCITCGLKKYSTAFIARKFVIALIGASLLLSCNGNDKNGATATDALTSAMKTRDAGFEKQLAQQIRGGYGVEKFETDYPGYVYGEADLAASTGPLKSYLASNGFRFPGEAEFNEKIRTIFGRTIDPKSAVPFLFIHFYENTCSNKIEYLRKTEELYTTTLYVFKKDAFVSELFALPELIDYQTAYPELAKLEQQLPAKFKDPDGEQRLVYYWKDFPNLDQHRKAGYERTLNRNKYLFNDSKSAAKWLVAHDLDFLKFMVKKYGYDKEPLFNEAIIEDFMKNEVEEVAVGDYIFRRNCNGQLDFRTGLLKSFTDLFHKEEEPRLLMSLKYFSSYLTQTLKDKRYTRAERFKMIAYLANVFDPLFKENLTKQPNWEKMTIMAELRSDLGESEWNVVQGIYKDNQYFGLPRLKEAIDYANTYE